MADGANPNTLADRARAISAVIRDDALIAGHWLLHGYPATSLLLPAGVRRRVLRRAGLAIAPSVTGLAHCYFMSNNIAIGARSHVQPGCVFEGAGRIEIGEECMIGPEVMLVTSHHEKLAEDRLEHRADYLPITIGPRCWLFARAMVLPGVTIGAGTVIAAGAVVASDCGPGGLYAGVPARRVR